MPATEEQSFFKREKPSGFSEPLRGSILGRPLRPLADDLGHPARHELPMLLDERVAALLLEGL
jgi:hypothetical protein